MQGKMGGTGMSPKRWKDFTPRLDVWGGGGGSGTPVLGVGSSQSGRYLYVPEMRLCIYDFMIAFGSSATLGGWYYLVELPMQAQRQMSGTGQGTPSSTLLGPGAIDRIIGNGFASQGSYEEPNVPLQFTVSDFPGFTYGGQSSQWCQGFCPYEIQSGTDTLTLTSKAVTFPWTMFNAPAASDIVVEFTSNQGSSSVHGTWITGVATTGFTINQQGAPLIPAPFSYKVRIDNTILAGPWAPFNLGATPGDSIRGHLVYETTT